MPTFFRILLSAGVATAISILITSRCSELIGHLFVWGHTALRRHAVGPVMVDLINAGMGGLAYMLPTGLLAATIYALLASQRSQPPSETLCRRCGYALRGLAKPQCPECGEHV